VKQKGVKRERKATNFLSHPEGCRGNGVKLSSQVFLLSNTLSPRFCYITDDQ